MRSDKSRRRFVFLCVAPATILFFLFMILPTLNVFRMSLYERGAYSPFQRMGSVISRNRPIMLFSIPFSGL